jgi:hypothetical protein
MQASKPICSAPGSAGACFQPEHSEVVSELMARTGWKPIPPIQPALGAGFWWYRPPACPESEGFETHCALPTPPALARQTLDCPRAHPRPAIARELEQELLAMAALREMPDKARQQVSIGARHRRLPQAGRSGPQNGRLTYFPHVANVISLGFLGAERRGVKWREACQ